MAKLTLRTPWTSQPQTPVGVDRGNPISRGLIAAYAPSAPLDRAANVLLSITGAPTFFGGMVTTNGSSSYVSRVPPNKAWANNQTILTIFTPLAVGSGSLSAATAFSCGTSRGGSAIGVNSSGLLTYGVMTSNGNGYISGGSSIVDKRSVAVGTKVAGNLQPVKLYLNGVNIASGMSLGNADHGGAAWEFAIGRGPGFDTNGGTTYANAATELSLVWDRVLSDAEISAISRNPWQVFQPLQRTIWVPAAAGGGSHATTGALSASAATIAGAATHLTLHTTSGALAASDATIAGSANRSTTHPTSGALVASDAIITGTAAHLTLHTSSGGLVAGDAALAGAAEHSAPGTHVTSGALTADAAVIAGSATHLALHTASGALVADSASIAGTALHTPIHAASGGLVAGEGALLGIALRTPAPTAHDASGGLVAGAAVISGLATGPALPFFSVSGGGIKPTHHKKPAPTLFDEELKAPTTKLKKAAVPSFTPSTFVPYAKMGVPKALSKALGEVLVGPLSAPLREVLPPEYDDDDIPDEVIMLALQ